jgi:predicted DNA-binding protein
MPIKNLRRIPADLFPSDLLKLEELVKESGHARTYIVRQIIHHALSQPKEFVLNLL